MTTVASYHVDVYLLRRSAFEVQITVLVAASVPKFKKPDRAR